MFESDVAVQNDVVLKNITLPCAQLYRHKNEEGKHK